MQRHWPLRYTPRPLVFCLILTSLLLTACGGTSAGKAYTIGVVNYAAVLEQVLAGFKAAMAASGYVEGTNVTYLYHGVINNEPQVIEREVQRVLDHKVDLLLTLGTRPTLVAKKATAGTDTPVVFAPAMAPVKEGIVESLSRPGGNMTGVQIIADSPKAVEWLLKLAPSTKLVYVPYHPDDRVAVATIRPLPAAAARLGLKLLLDAVHTPEAVLAAIEALPKDAGILFIPTPGLASHTSAFRHRARARGIPTGAYALFGEDVLFTYGPDRHAQGKQAARLAAQILQGTKPADLLVETAELFLQINLQTATAIGLDIPDEFLRQADTIMR